MANKANGWIKLHRRILDNPIAKKPLWVWLWICLLLKANHQDQEFIFNGEKKVCKRGQLLTSRKLLSMDGAISQSSVERCLKYLETEQQIEQQKTSKYRLISIINYGQYQKLDSKMDSKRTASGQQADSKPDTIEEDILRKRNALKKEKNEKNEKNELTVNLIIDDLNSVLGTDYKLTVRKTKELINIRIKEGFTLEDFKKVHRIKFNEWNKDDKMSKFLRPETLYSNKFEGYLNQKEIKQEKKKRRDEWI